MNERAGIKFLSPEMIRPLLILGMVGVCLLLVSSWWSNKSSNVPSDSAQKGVAVSSSSLTGIVQPESVKSGGGSEEEVLEQRIGSILQQIAGVGEVKVSISLGSGTRYEYATNQKNDQRQIEERDERGGTRTTSEQTLDEQIVLLSGSAGSTSGQPLKVREIKPEIKGVLVVAEGARNAEIKEALTRTVQTVLNVPAYKIRVMPRAAER